MKYSPTTLHILWLLVCLTTFFFTARAYQISAAASGVQPSQCAPCAAAEARPPAPVVANPQLTALPPSKAMALSSESQAVEPANGTTITQQSSTPSPEELRRATSKRALAEMRVRAINRFVPLSDVQRARLADAFGSGKKKAEQDAELEAVIGADNVKFFREQAQASFARANDAALEKDVLYLSRQLELTPGEEGQFRSIYQQLDRQLTEESKALPTAVGMQEAMARMIEQAQRRKELLAGGVRDAISQDKAQQLEALQRDDAEGELELWH